MHSPEAVHRSDCMPGQADCQGRSIPVFMHTWFCVTQLRQVALL
jgi:hypothetical protein